MSASIFQAVVNQTISGLACGKPIRGHVAFLGGPLHFLSELKEAFIRTLHLTGEYIIAPENSHLFAAMGAAMNDCNENGQTLDELIGLLSSDIKIEAESKRMDPLFKNPAEYEAFTNRHNKHTVKKGRLEAATKATASSVSMPAPQRPKPPSSVRTAPCSTLSTAEITAVL